MSDDTSQTYDAIFIHYLDPHSLMNAIRSLLCQSIRPTRIIVVDNSSHLMSLSVESDLMELITVLPAGSNLGYGPAANIGLTYLGEEISSFVVLLTQDALLDQECCAAMLNTMTDPQVGGVGPIIFRRSATDTVYSAGGRVFPGGQVRHIEQNSDQPLHGDSRVVDWVDGAVLMLNVSAIYDVGFFRPEYFLYYEEVDLCTRLKDAGYKIKVSLSAKAWQEPGNYTPYLRIRNQILFWKNFKKDSLLLPIIGYQLVRTSIGLLMRKNPVGIMWATRGAYDGMRGLGGTPPDKFWHRRKLVQIVKLR